MNHVSIRVPQRYEMQRMLLVEKPDTQEIHIVRIVKKKYSVEKFCLLQVNTAGMPEN